MQSSKRTLGSPTSDGSHDSKRAKKEDSAEADREKAQGEAGDEVADLEKTSENRSPVEAESNQREESKSPVSQEAEPASRPKPIEFKQDVITFPVKLYTLIQSGEFSKAMWWLPRGDSFRIVPKHFTDLVLQKHFQGTKFESFTRKLNRWGFKKVICHDFESEPDTVTYQHEAFHRDKPDLVKEMKGGKKKGMLKGAPSQELEAASGAQANLNAMNAARSSLLQAHIAGQQSLQQQLLQARGAQLQAQLGGHGASPLLSSDLAARQRVEQALVNERLLAAQQASLQSAGTANAPLHQLQMLRELQAQRQLVPSSSSSLGQPSMGGATNNGAAGVSSGQQAAGFSSNQQRLLQLYLRQEEERKRQSQGR